MRQDIFDTLSETHQQDFGRLFNNENWVSKHVQGRHSQSQPSFIKPAVHFISADSAPSPRPSHSSSQPPSTGPLPTYLYVYLPYLHFDTYRHVIQRRKVITRRLAHGRARPVPEDIAALESLELRMIWEYMGHDPALNGRRTLDQFGYPSLKDTYARDDDQMLYKLTKEEMIRPSPKIDVLDDVQSVGSLVERYSFGTKLLHQVIEREKEHAEMSDSEISVEPDLRDGNLLMVDQLWLWAIDTSESKLAWPCCLTVEHMTDMSQQPSQPSSRRESLVHLRVLCSSRRTSGIVYTTSSMAISRDDVKTPWTWPLLLPSTQ